MEYCPTCSIMATVILESLIYSLFSDTVLLQWGAMQTADMVAQPPTNKK